MGITFGTISPLIVPWVFVIPVSVAMIPDTPVGDPFTVRYVDHRLHIYCLFIAFTHVDDGCPITICFP